MALTALVAVLPVKTFVKRSPSTDDNSCTIFLIWSSEPISEIYTSDYFTPWSFKEYKDDHTHQIISLIKGKITDFKFGFDDDDEEDDYYDFDFDDDFNIDDIISESDKNIDEDILEINEPEKKSSKSKKTVSKKSTKKKATTKKAKK